jgi:hypothetical protein
VVDNVVWTDSWPSIAGVDCGLVRVVVGDPKSSKDHFGVFKNSEKIKKIIEKSSFKSFAALSCFFWIFSRLHFTLF